MDDLFTRATSIESYHYLVENKILGKRQMEVYEILFHYGPLTANEVFNVLKSRVDRKFLFDSNTRARFTELRDMDLIQENGTKICSITGRNVILWCITGRLPRQKPKSDIQEKIHKINKQIMKLEKIRENLEAKL